MRPTFVCVVLLSVWNVSRSYRNETQEVHFSDDFGGFVDDE